MKFTLRKFFLCLSLFLNISETTIFAQSASFNGNNVPPNGQLRVLMVFIQINYDQNTPNGVPNYWAANTLPPNINDFFEPAPGTNPNAKVSRMLRDASFGNFEILGDFYNNLITVNQSNINGLTEGNVINNAIQQINASIQNNSFSTGSYLQLTQFDLTRAKNQGVFANPTPNGDIDMVMYFFRNFPNGSGGRVNQGSFDPINGMQSDLRSIMHGADWQLIRHEFMHTLFGENNFHCAGGQHNSARHPFEENYFAPLQNGWGLMGDERSSFMTCNAWDRDRLNWFHPDRENEIQNDPNLSITPNQHNVFCHDGTGVNSSSIESDLDPANPNDAGIYWIHDFMTTGDAIRIRLPFIDPVNEFEQWLWLENHQTSARNNNFLDDFNHIGLGSNCKPNATPGLYAYVQVEKNVKESTANNDAFDGFGDFLRFIPAHGFFDYEEVGTGTECIYGGTWPKFNPLKSNPLSGTSELEHHISDHNNNNQIHRLETKIFTIENNITSLIHQGHTRQAFTLTGNNRLGMGTNPSANNMLTEVSFNNAEPYGNQGINNNRTVYLNGVSVEIIDEQANANNANMMDLQIRVRFDDVLIDQNVNYSADNIVLPNILQGGADMEIAANRCVFIYHGTTPTKVGRIGEDSTTVYDGVTYFSQPTKFFIESNANALLNSGATIEVQDDSRLTLRENSSITLLQGAKVLVQDDATMVLEQDAVIDFAVGSKIEVKDNATLIIKSGNAVSLTGAVPHIQVKGNGKLIIEDDAKLLVGNSGLIEVLQGGTLEYRNTVANKGLQLGQPNGSETELRLAGTLEVINTDFTFTGNGFIHFYPTNQLNLPQGKSFYLSGQHNADLIAKFQPNTLAAFEDNNLSLTDGKIEVDYNAKFDVRYGSQIYFKNARFISTGITPNAALYAFQNNTVNIQNSTFWDFDGTGTPLELAENKKVFINNSTFNNCGLGTQLSNNTFTNITNTQYNGGLNSSYGVYIENQRPTYFSSTTFSNYLYGVWAENAEGIYLNESTLSNCDYGIYGTDSEVFLRSNTKVENANQDGVKLEGTAKYASLLVMGDVGCAEISGSSRSGIAGHDAELSIDAVEHALSGLNSGYVNPNRIFCNNRYNVEMCYKIDYDNQNNFIAPHIIHGKGNFYKKDEESCVTPQAPTSADFYCTTSGACNNQITFDFTNYSLCVPVEGDCKECGKKVDPDVGHDEYPSDGANLGLRTEFAAIYPSFIAHDTATTRAAFVSLAAIDLFKIQDDVWAVSIAGDTIDINDQDAQLIIVAKCLYQDTSGLKSGRIHYPGAVDLFKYAENKSLDSPTTNPSFSVFPNPTSNQFTIKSGNMEPTHFQLLSINKTVLKLGEFMTETTVNTSDLTPGIYLLKLDNSQTSETRKIIIE